MIKPDPEDPLETLRAHLRSAQVAAERLLAESEETPPAGWEPRSSASWREPHALSELVRSIRESLPEDVLAEVADLIRALLNVLRALVDVLLSRLTPTQRPAGGEVQEIPIV